MNGLGRYSALTRWLIRSTLCFCGKRLVLGLVLKVDAAASGGGRKNDGVTGRFPK